MKVAITTDQYLPQLGGVADSIVSQVEGLRALGHTVRIYAPAMEGAIPDPDVVRLPTLTIGGMFNFVSPFGLGRALREFQPDAIHAHALGILTLATIRYGRVLGIPVVGTCHGFPADYLGYFYLGFWPLPALTNRFTAWFFDRFACTTAPAAQTLDTLRSFGAKSRHMEVVSNPVDTRLFRRLENQQELKERMGITHRAILLFGRIAAEKNLEQAVVVAAHAITRTGAQLVVVGDGPYRATLERLVREAGIAEKTLFTGRLGGDALVAAINACEVMLITSKTEAQPMTILQANCCGVPVVGIRAGGVPDAITHGETGYVIDHDDNESFSDHVARLLTDDALRARMGSEAQARVAAYSPQRIAERYVTLFSDLIARRTGT